MAKLSTYATRTPLLTDYASGVGDPGGTPLNANYTFAAIRDLLQANLTSATITGATLTGSDATTLVDISQTWNTTGTPTALKLNVTDTASNAASKLIDLQVGGSTKFYVSKIGNVVIASTQTIGAGGSAGISFPGAFRVAFSAVGGAGMISMWDGLRAGFNIPIGWTTGTGDSGTFDTRLYRDGTGLIAQRNGTAAQAFRVYNTYTDASNYERGALTWNSNIFEIGTEAAGTGTVRAMSLTPADIRMPNLPTSDPTVAGRLWNNGGVLTVSAG